MIYKAYIKAKLNKDSVIEKAIEEISREVAVDLIESMSVEDLNKVFSIKVNQYGDLLNAEAKISRVNFKGNL